MIEFEKNLNIAYEKHKTPYHIYNAYLCPKRKLCNLDEFEFFTKKKVAKLFIETKYPEEKKHHDYFIYLKIPFQMSGFESKYFHKHKTTKIVESGTIGTTEISESFRYLNSSYYEQCKKNLNDEMNAEKNDEMNAENNVEHNVEMNVENKTNIKTNVDEINAKTNDDEKSYRTKESDFNVALYLNDNDVLGKGGYGSVTSGYFIVQQKPQHIDCNSKIIKSISENHVVKMEFYKVAIKRIKVNHLSKHEIDILNKLTVIPHKKSVSFITYFEDEKYQYIITEKAQFSLSDFITKNNHMRLFDKVKYFFQIVDILHFLKKSNIVHRDIKPENILVDNYNQLKLCDFGQAVEWKKKNVTDFIEFKKRCGTYKYFSPEMVEGIDYDDNTDVWSAGVTMYRLIYNGMNPFIDDKIARARLLLKFNSLKAVCNLTSFEDYCNPIIRTWTLENILKRDFIRPKKTESLQMIVDNHYDDNYNFGDYFLALLETKILTKRDFRLNAFQLYEIVTDTEWNEWYHKGLIKQILF